MQTGKQVSSKTAGRSCRGGAHARAGHGGHARRQQEEASSSTDQNMGQTSKLPDCLTRPPGPAKPGTSEGHSCSRGSARTSGS